MHIAKLKTAVLGIVAGMWLQIVEAETQQSQLNDTQNVRQKHFEDKYQDRVKALTEQVDSKAHPMAQRANQAYQDYQTSDVAGAFAEELARHDVEVKAEGVLLFFFSSSMPERAIKSYLAQAEKINQHIIFVLRGTVDNSLSILPTVEYLKAIKTFSGCGQSLCQRAVNTVIDPRLFEQYSISTVPALVYSREFSSDGYFDHHQLPSASHHTTVVGEATLPFLVKTLSEEISNEHLATIANTYRF